MQGKLRPKKLKAILSSLRDSDLGPYSGGSYTGPRGDSVRLTKCALSELEPGLNAEKVVLGKVVCSLKTDNQVHL